MERPTTSATSAASSPASDRRRGRGFTLVELLVVIAIIAVLAALLLPMLAKMRTQAQVTAQKHDFQAIAQALDAFKNDFGYYPDNYGGSVSIGLGNFLVSRYPDWWGHGMGIRPGRDNTSNQVAGRIYGPYLQPEKWKIVTIGQAGGQGSLSLLMDRWGGPIAYFPRRQVPAAGNNLMGFRYGGNPFEALGTAGQFEFTDGWPYNLNNFGEFFRIGWAYAFCVRLGDDDCSGYIDLNKGERLRFDGPYILVSGGPDAVDKPVLVKGVPMNFGFEDFDANNDYNVDEPNVLRDTTRWVNSYGQRFRYCIPAEARRRIDKSDDIYNFER